MPFLNYAAIGTVLSLVLLAGYQKINIVSLEKDLIISEQAKEEWKKSDEKLRVKLTDAENSAKVANDLNNNYIATVLTMQKDYILLQQELQNANQKTEELSRVFAEHDFEFLLKAKPGLMQRRIRSASKQLLNRFVPSGDPTGSGPSGDKTERTGIN